MPPSSKKKSGRIPELDGLRGIAILLVIFFHYTQDAPGYATFGAAYRFRQLFRLGWTGVDLFFVLSGFLIGGILLEARQSNHYFSTFYARRAFRILPIYFVWIGLYAAAVGIMHKWPLPALSAPTETLRVLPLFLVFGQSLIEFGRTTLAWYWLGPTWSLAIEEQFYLVAAPVVRLLSDRGLFVALISTIFVSPLLRMFVYTRWGQVFYLLSFCRADSLAIGILVAMGWRSERVKEWIWRHRKRVYGTLAMTALPMLAFLKWSYEPGKNVWAAGFEVQWIAIFFAVLLVTVLAYPADRIPGIFRWRFLMEIGRISYCAYLIHFVVSALLHEIVLKQQPTLNSVAGVSLAFCAFALTIAIAELSATYFEGPLLQYGHHFRY